MAQTEEKSFTDVLGNEVKVGDWVFWLNDKKPGKVRNIYCTGGITYAHIAYFTGYTYKSSDYHKTAMPIFALIDNSVEGYHGFQHLMLASLSDKLRDQLDCLFEHILRAQAIRVEHEAVCALQADLQKGLAIIGGLEYAPRTYDDKGREVRVCTTEELK